MSSSSELSAANAPALALYTYGVFRQPADHRVNTGFQRLNDPVFAAVDEAPGLIARSGYPDEPSGPPEWGEQVFPEGFDPHGDGWAPATLSLWQSVEAARAFSYAGIHALALKRRQHWFDPAPWPGHVAWWHGHPTEPPNWAEAVRRHAELWHQGCGPEAFTLHTPYDVQGRQMTIAPGANPVDEGHDGGSEKA